MRAVQFVFAQPRGGEDVQPVAAVEPRDLRGVEQARALHVVEEEQATVRFAGVGEFLQLAAGALGAGVHPGERFDAGAGEAPERARHAVPE